MHKTSVIETMDYAVVVNSFNYELDSTSMLQYVNTFYITDGLGEIMKRKNLFMGTIILGIGGIVSKLLGFCFRIPLIYMIGEEGIGLYQLTYPLYTFILSITAGIPTAISKMISERNAIHKQKEAHDIFRAALFIMAVFGCTSSICIIVFSETIMTTFKWNKGAYYSLMGIGLAPLFTCLLSAFKGYFQGLQIMTIPAGSQVIEQITRILVGIGLAYILLPKGIAVSAGGASFGATVGSVVGILWMVYNLKKNEPCYAREQESKSMSLLSLEIIKFSIPISIGQAIGSIMALLDSIIVPGLLKSSGYSEQLATQLYGQLTGKAFVLVNIPLTLSIALAQSIVPVISESNAVRDFGRLKRNIKMSYKMAMIIALPCSAGLFALAKPIMKLVFQNNEAGWELLQILAISAVFIIIAQTSTSILNGAGKLLLPLISILIGGVIKVSLSIIYIPDPALNIKAAAYSTLISYAFVALIDFIFVIVFTKMYINIFEIFISPAICSIVMILCAITVYSKVFSITGGNSRATLAAIVAAGLIYAFMLIVTKTLSISELKNIVRK
jgi:stage V sporulation protein B